MAIILLHNRPVLRIEKGTFAEFAEPWQELERHRTTIETAIACVGRLESSDQTLPFLSTAFSVAEDIILTTRHVVDTFAKGIGDKQLKFRDDRKIWIDFKAEGDNNDIDRAAVTDLVFIHPYWDIAALRIDAARPFIKLRASAPQEGDAISVIGYPAFDMRCDAEIQKRIFEDIYNIKRLMPARIQREKAVYSYGRDVKAIAHDASTLGGTAGAPLLDVASGEVVGVNFAGAYLTANYAVPAWELMRDSCVRNHLNLPEPEWMALWEEPVAAASPPVVQGGVPGINLVKKYSYLSNDEIYELCDLLLLGFPDDERISALFVGIPPEIVAALPVGANPKEKLLKRLFEMNRFGRIGEHTPLYELLQSACYLRKVFPEHPQLNSLFLKVAASES